MKTEFSTIAQRMDNAVLNFVEICQDRGFTADEGRKILAAYKKAKAVKMDAVNGRYNVVHGALLDVDVMRRALDM